MRISDWSSDVCSSDLHARFDLLGRRGPHQRTAVHLIALGQQRNRTIGCKSLVRTTAMRAPRAHRRDDRRLCIIAPLMRDVQQFAHARRSEEHTSELQSLMRISYAVFCLNKTTSKDHTHY